MALRFTRRNRGGGDRDATSVPLAPLIDMIFILLIFFLVTASFVKETGVDVKKPKSYTGKLLPGDHVIVTIESDGRIRVGDRPVKLNRLPSRLERKISVSGQKKVVIASDERVQTGLLVQVMDRCREAGAEDVSIATRKQQ